MFLLLKCLTLASLLVDANRLPLVSIMWWSSFCILPQMCYATVLVTYAVFLFSPSRCLSLILKVPHLVIGPAITPFTFTTIKTVKEVVEPDDSLENFRRTRYTRLRPKISLIHSTMNFVVTSILASVVVFFKAGDSSKWLVFGVSILVLFPILVMPFYKNLKKMEQNSDQVNRLCLQHAKKNCSVCDGKFAFKYQEEFHDHDCLLHDAQYPCKVCNSVQNMSCSGSETEWRSVRQKMYECKTCGKDEICQTCKRFCHEGHEVKFKKIVSFVCSCNQVGNPCMFYCQKHPNFKRSCIACDFTGKNFCSKMTMTTAIEENVFSDCYTCHTCNITAMLCKTCIKNCHKRHHTEYAGNLRQICVCGGKQNLSANLCIFVCPKNLEHSFIKDPPTGCKTCLDLDYCFQNGMCTFNVTGMKDLDNFENRNRCERKMCDYEFVCHTCMEVCHNHVEDNPNKDLGLIKNKDNLAVVEPNVEKLNISSQGDQEIAIPMDMYQEVAETSDIQTDLELTVDIPGGVNSKEIEDNIEGNIDKEIDEAFPNGYLTIPVSHFEMHNDEVCQNHNEGITYIEENQEVMEHNKDNSVSQHDVDISDISQQVVSEIPIFMEKYQEMDKKDGVQTDSVLNVDIPDGLNNDENDDAIEDIVDTDTGVHQKEIEDTTHKEIDEPFPNEDLTIQISASHLKMHNNEVCHNHNKDIADVEGDQEVMEHNKDNSVSPHNVEISDISQEGVQEIPIFMDKYQEMDKKDEVQIDFVLNVDMPDGLNNEENDDAIEDIDDTDLDEAPNSLPSFEMFHPEENDDPQQEYPELQYNTSKLLMQIQEPGFYCKCGAGDLQFPCKAPKISQIKKKNAIDLLTTAYIGNYLVWKDRSNPVLSFKTEKTIIHLHLIKNRENKISVDKIQFFDSVDQMINFYKTNILMHYNTKLVESDYEFIY